MTLPRLQKLVEAYVRRAQRERHDAAASVAIAYHAPERLKELAPEEKKPARSAAPAPQKPSERWW